MEGLSKNFIWLGAANIVNSLFSFLLFIYLARILEPAAFGYFSYAFTLIFFLANFIDLGLSTYGIREIAKDRPRLSEYASEIVSFRLIIALILALVLVMVSLFFGGVSTQAIIIIESSLVLMTCALTTEWAFQGVEKMHMVFISLAVTSALQLGLIFAFVRSPASLLRAPILYFVATLPTIIFFLWRLKFRPKTKPVDIGRIVGYLSSSLVIWSISLFAQVYNGLDIFMLGLFRPIGEVGYFTIARRITGAFVFFMVFLVNAVLPRLSCTFSCDVKEFNRAIRKFLGFAVIFTLFILLPLIVFSRQIISLTVGAEYIPADAALKLLTIGLVLVLFNLPYSTALIAARFEKDVMMQAAAAAVVSIVLNFILMPRYGMIGASVSFVLVEALALLWILVVYNKKMRKGGITW